MKKIILFVVLILIAAAGVYFLVIKKAGQPETGKEPTEAVKEERVSIKNFAFNPQTLVVDLGTKVIWKNEDAAPHTVTSQGNFDSGALSQGEEFILTFEEAGTFDYICTFHPGMKAKIIAK